MSLLSYDPLFGVVRHHHRRSADPWAMLDTFFNDASVPQLRDHSAQFSVDKNGHFSYKVDASGFRPEELTVDLDGNEVVVSGEHKSQNEHEIVERSFVRRVCIPDGIEKETIQSHLDDRGHLSITGRKAGSAESRRSIPIGIKKAIDNKQEQKQPQK